VARVRLCEAKVMYKWGVPTRTERGGDEVNDAFLIRAEQ
jgi:hypothetical protein